MPEEKFTRCPGCKTIFRVTPAQLEMRAGQVRCGHCHTVFDGTRELISLAPVAHDEEADDERDEAALGPPTVTLRDARSLKNVEPERDDAAAAHDDRADDFDEIAYEERFAWDKRKRKHKREFRKTMALALPILLLALLAQVVFHFRDAIAAHWPPVRPALAKICAAAGCAIRPLRDVAGLSIEASDLQADAAHRGLLILTATVRNRAPFPLAYPYLELTLTDSQDEPVVRRALAPADFAGGTADLEGGIPANGEVSVKLFIDASATTQAGYRLYLFYP